MLKVFPRALYVCVKFLKFKIPLFFQFGFRKWKGNVTERPIEDRSGVIKELYSDLTLVKPQEGPFFLSTLIAF